MAAKMAVGRVWRSRLLVAISVPVLGVPFLQTVKAGSMKVHPRELEIYDPVEASQDKLNEEEITALEEKVSVGRRFVWGWTSKVKDGVANLRNTLSSVEDKSLEFVELIRTDRQFQMKVGGITTAVFGGALLAGRGRRPIRRIFFSSVLGTSAAAICYPKQAVEITQTNYHRLKVFINEQRNKYNQKQAEKAAKEELKNPVSEETQISEDQDNPTVEVAKEEDVKSQIEVSDVQEKTTEPAVAAEEKPQSSIWSKVPFLDKFIGGKSSATGVVSPVQVSEEKDAANTESSKDQVIVQEDSSSQVKAEGDTGQSNPEDKDMYSTRT